MFKVDLNSHIGTWKRALWCKCAGKYSGIRMGEQQFRTAPSSVWTLEIKLHFLLSAARHWEAEEEFVELVAPVRLQHLGHLLSPYLHSDSAVC